MLSDTAILAAVRSANPLAPLPSDYKDKQALVEFKYDYKFFANEKTRSFQNCASGLKFSFLKPMALVKTC